VLLFLAEKRKEMGLVAPTRNDHRQQEGKQIAGQNEIAYWTRRHSHGKGWLRSSCPGKAEKWETWCWGWLQIGDWGQRMRLKKAQLSTKGGGSGCKHATG